MQIYVIIVFTFAITLTTNAAKEEDTENRAQNRYHTFDGTPNTYYFGYDSKSKDAPRLMREETRLSDGTVTGRYGYTDPFGVFRVVKYVSGNNGYYASEEIGEQVTSSTPQYYKATAPQVESVSEEPVSYSSDLATKFNPPLYHPEAHTMAPDETPYQEQPEVDRNGQPYSTVDTSSNNHQIFSLSNSEDILEKKYRERKQLERTSRGYQSERPINVVVRQPVNKRVAHIAPRFDAPPYETFVPTNRDNRRINALSNENQGDFKPIIRRNNNNNNDFLRRPQIQYNRQNDSQRLPISETETKVQNINYLKESDNKNITNEYITETTETLVTETPVSSTSSTTERPLVEDNLPDNIRHLYYRPTRSPVVYSTSISRESHKIKSDSPNKTETIPTDEEQADVWSQIRHLFTSGSSTTTESMPTTTTEIPNNTNSSEESLPPNEAKTVFFSPIRIEDDREIFRRVPGQIESSSRYRDYIPSEELIVSDHDEEHLSENITLLTPNQNQNFSETTTENNNYENIFNNSEHSSVLSATHDNNNYEQAEGTTHSPHIKSEHYPLEFFTETPRLAKLNLEEEQNQSTHITKSGFFHDFLLRPSHNVGIQVVPQLTAAHPLSDDESVETTPNYDLQDLELNHTLSYSDEKTTERPSHEPATNEQKFLDNFWNNFNEQSVLYSEAHLHNQTNTQNDSKLFTDETKHWISEQMDTKSIMFSEGRVNNKSADYSMPFPITTQTIATTTEPIPTTRESIATTTEEPAFGSKISEISTQTTLISTEPSTTVTTTTSPTTTPDITTTDLVNKEFLDRFWHNFNDNSEEYSQIDLENKTNTESELNTTYPQINITSAEELLILTSDKNITEMENSLTTTGRQDLDLMEDTNHSLNTSSFGARFLPSVQPSDQNQNIPPLSALFEFPHMRKRVRRVQRLRNQQTINPEEPTTTTSTPEEVDIMSTDATEDVLEISDSEEDPSHLKTTASQRYYQYVPPFQVLKETYIQDEIKPQEFKIGKPIQYSQAFDDMSEIMTSIESMRKPIRPQTEGRSQPTPASKVVEFDDKPDSFVPILLKRSRSKGNTRSQMRYLFPLEPLMDTTSDKQLSDVIEINRNVNSLRAVHRYEPIIKFEV